MEVNGESDEIGKGGALMQLPFSEELNIANLGRLFDNTSECYKFFWFKAIVEKVILLHVFIVRSRPVKVGSSAIMALVLS